MSGFTAGCFYHAIRCNGKPKKELAPALALIPMRVKNETDEIMGQDKM
jgi:hypothetical protein